VREASLLWPDNTSAAGRQNRVFHMPLNQGGKMVHFSFFTH
jgi:hypothetical protein